jgi:acetyltransferase-like isoleucine patch superfamily enzyme
MKKMISWIFYEAPRYLLVPYYLFYFYFFKFPFRVSWKIYGTPIVRGNNNVTIGDNFVMRSSVSRNSIGVSQPVIIRLLNKGATLCIGDNVGLSGCSIITADTIKIGNDVLIGTGVIIMDNDLHDIHYSNRRLFIENINPKPIIIKNGVFIGARAIILKGVTIGEGAVIGAGAVVSRNVLPYTIVAGNPAKYVKNVE